MKLVCKHSIISTPEEASLVDRGRASQSDSELGRVATRGRPVEPGEGARLIDENDGVQTQHYSRQGASLVDRGEPAKETQN